MKEIIPNTTISKATTMGISKMTLLAHHRPILPIIPTDNSIIRNSKNAISKSRPNTNRDMRKSTR